MLDMELVLLTATVALVLGVCSPQILSTLALNAAHYDDGVQRFKSEEPTNLTQLDITCLSQSVYVFPFWSLCSRPARFFTQAFTLYGLNTSDLSLARGFQPQGDALNSTFYVRLVNDTGATYTVLYNLSAAGGFEYDEVFQHFPIHLQNKESQRYWTWKTSNLTVDGDSVRLLVEVDSFDKAATFWLLENTVISSQLPCLNSSVLRCSAYFISSVPPERGQAASGLLSYRTEEADDLPYITLDQPSRTGDLPLLLVREVMITTASASASAKGALEHDLL